MTRRLWPLLLAPLLLGLPWLFAGERPRDADKPRLRRPISLLLADGGKTLLVANRDAGTVSVIDTTARQVVAEPRVGRRLSALAATPKRDVIVATDEEAGDLVVLAYQGGALREVRRRKVGPTPVAVQLGEDGRCAAVSLLWARRVALVDLGDQNAATFVDLPFAPRSLLLAPGGDRLIVADSFAGRLAVVDVARAAVDSVRDFPIHNIRGLALDRSGKHILLAHQRLHPRGRPAAGDIQAGNVVSNHLRKLSLAALLEPGADVARDERLYSLGDVERGAGDPAELAEFAPGEVAVAIAGTDEVHVGRPEEALWTRLPVGRRPTALALDPAAGRAYVASTFADSVSIVDVKAGKALGDIPLGPVAALRPEERGELLFHDARLSFEAWYSCQSCHTDGHTPGRLNDNFTDGSFGTPKRVLTLLGTKDTGPWAWGGHMPELEKQIHTSVKSTMQGPTPTSEQVSDLAAYLRTLAPPPSVAQTRGALDATAVERGRRVFARQKCNACHTPPTYTSPKTYDVGLRDEAGGTQFNPPSLHGVSQGGPYFHDGRAATLQEVFTRHRHQLPQPLPERELSDLLQFLGSL